MKTEYFLELVSMGRENRRVEFKQSTPWDNKIFQAKLVKTVLAFSNVRDGGYILIGVRQGENDEPILDGVNAEHLATYSEDSVKSVVSEYADPFILLELDRVEHNGKNFLAISVQEFLEIPVICKQDGRENLRRGAIYTRTHRIPESAEVPTQTEMREILDMASEKKLRSYFQMQNRIGASGVDIPTDAESFKAELRDLL